MSCRAALLAGICIPALFAIVPPATAGSPTLFSQGWFTTTAGNRTAGTAGAGAGASGLSGGGTGIPAQSLSKVQQSINDLTKAAQAIAAAQSVQNQARAAALAQPTTVPDGLTAGGLQVDPGVAQGTAVWTGAALPAQATANGGVGVTVRQTASQALLNWRTFNVGRNTDLTFDQSAGGASASTWVVLNRVNDPSAQPSQILGSISAQGQVLIMNRNGVIFGAGSQVNVGSLVAATTASYGVPNGIGQFTATAAADALTLADGFVLASGSVTPTLANAGGAVTVEAGASITTAAPASATAHGGSVLLLGTAVTNNGQITTPNGQTILAAGQNFILRQGYQTSSSSSSYTSTTLGTEAAVCVASASRCQGGVGNGGPATNSGLIQATTGDVTLVGQGVTQAGVIVTTTSVNTRGTIHLLTDTGDPTASVTLAPGSLTMVGLDTSGSTATNAQRAGLTSQAYQAPTTSLLNDEPASATDLLDESRIEITTGGTASFLGDSTTLATGGQIIVNAYKRAFFGTGAALDVAGSLDVTLPASANILKVNLQGYELRDDPTNRDTGSITSTTVYIDERQLVALNGYQYTTGGLAEVSGYVNSQGHTIQEWTTPGGSITVNSQLIGSDVIAQPGAIFNIAGGSVRYQAGYVPTTWLIGSNGRLYNINTAPSDIVYTGVYDGFTVNHARWGVTQTYRDALIAPTEIYQGGYTVGRDGGTLSLNGPAYLQATSSTTRTSGYSVVFEGTVDAGVVTGERQYLPRTANTASYLQPQNAVPLPGQLVVDFADTAEATPSTTTNVRITDSATPVAASIGPDDALPANRINTAFFSASGLDAAGLGGLSITTYGSIAVDAPLMLATGGQLTLAAPSVAISSPLTARAGSVSIGNALSTSYLNPPSRKAQDAGVSLSATASIDTRGVWTNLTTDPQDLAGLAAINGGAVTLDSSENLSLAVGSTIDASSGGAILSAGATKSGTGGAITLVAYDPGDTILPQVPTSPLVLGTRLVGVGANQGGNLTIKVPLVQIGVSDSAPAAGQLALPASFFASGFSSYDISGYQGVTVTAGTQVQVVEPVFQITAASAGLPTGSDPAAAMAMWLPPLFTPNPATGILTQRQGASLALHALTGASSTEPQGGPLTIGPGAAITLDPGQTATLEAFQQITIDGTVTVPHGTIQVWNHAEVVASNYANEYVAPAQYLSPLTPPAVKDPRNFAAGMSIWLGADSRLDVAGIAVTAQDSYGRSYGVVQDEDGGTIAIGSPSSGGITTAAYVVARPGSVLDASGAPAATIDLDAGGAPTLTASGLVVQRNTVSIAGNGGSISFDSESGIVLEGTMRATSGGAGAQGGSLSITLWTPVYGKALAALPPSGTSFNYPVLADSQRAPRELIVSQTTMPSGLPASLAPGDSATPFNPGQARISVTQITAGGFDNVSLKSDDMITFDGTVSLSVGRTLALQTGSLAERQPDGVVTLSAPYVTLSGVIGNLGGVLVSTGNLSNSNLEVGSTYQDQDYQWQPYAGSSTARLLIKAGVIDVSGPITSGYSVGSNLGTGVTDANGNLVTRTGIPSAEAQYDADVHQYAPGLITTFERPGFTQITLASTGDLRFQPDLQAAPATLVTSGNVTLSAAQIYPVAGANAKVYAGVNYDQTAANFFQPNSLIVITSPGGALPSVPLTAGGTLTLAAGEIDQGGVLRAPFGQITLGATGTEGYIDNNFGAGLQAAPAVFTTSVKLLPGSLTSVSGEGATIPFGGTADGTSYTVCTAAAGCATPTPTLAPTLSLIGQTISVASGATLDLSGGGQLAGSAFIEGRGGSYDILQTPLLRLSKTNVVTAPALASNAVYAIVPGQQADAAPPQQTQTTWSGSPLLAVGEQITIGAGVPGLPAGTYTLMPANFALLPGAYRVELATTNHTPLPGAVALGNGSYLVNGNQGIAGTGVRDALPIQITVSSGAVIRNDAQYNEENYSQYVTAQAALFGAARTTYIPADAGTLAIAFAGGPQADGSGRTAFAFAGQATLGAAAGGYGGTAEVAVLPSSSYGGLDILPTGGTPLPGDVGAPAADLNALGAATLSIGGIADYSEASSGIIYFDVGITTSKLPIYVRSGAVLRAPQVFLIADSSRAITVEQGAGINTLGLGFSGLDFASGLVYQPQDGYSEVNVLAVSNGQLVFIPPSVGGQQGSALAIGTCVTFGACSGTTTLYTDGTIAFASQNATFGNNVKFGASRLDISVGAVNLGSGATLAAAATAAGGTLPGLTLTDTALSTLLAGDPSVGTPSLQHLSLTTSELNLYGSADPFNPATTGARLAAIDLNTPAIYGYGTSSDRFTLTSGTLYWNGIENSPGSTNPPAQSAQPGFYASSTIGTGTLTINASNIVLGNGPEDRQYQDVALYRWVQGFSAVTLNATGSISANNWGTLTAGGNPYVSATKTLPSPRTNLTLNTPMLTGQAGSLNTITATGALAIVGGGGAAPAGVTALGAELHLGGDPSITALNTTPWPVSTDVNLWPTSITIDTTIGLPGGRLTVNATGDVMLGAGSTLDLSGRAYTLFNATTYGWGGDVLIESAAGNVTQAAGGRIDVSAVNADAGAITITATAASGGAVSLNGTLAGASTGTAPGAGGSFGVRAQSLGAAGALSDEFAALNASLDAGGFTGSRTFDFKQGSLDITGTVTASDVEVSVDSGSLTVAGTINASGPHPGTIRLSAQDTLAIGGGAVLDAHATQAWTDSYGVAIPAENQATIELNAGLGVAGGAANPDARLRIDPGARLDVSSPAAAQIGNQGVVALNVADRANGTINVSVPAGVAIAGAQTAALYGFTTTVINGSATLYQDLTSGALYVIDAAGRSHPILSSSTTPAVAGGDIAGLFTLGSAYSRRAGVQIVTTATGTDPGDLTVAGATTGNSSETTAGQAVGGLTAIDLSQLRPGGEPGALVLRADGNLNVNGSINDGFAVLQQQVLNPLEGYILPNTAGVSNFSVSGTTLKVNVTPSGTIYLGATVTSSNGETATVVKQDSNTDSKDRSGKAGTYTLSNSNLNGLTSSSGIKITVKGALLIVTSNPNDFIITTGDNISGSGVQAGTQVYATPTYTNNPDTGTTYSVSPAPQTVGTSTNLANLIIPTTTETLVGSTILSGPSWSLRLVAGADTASADTRTVLATSALPAATANNQNPGSIALGSAGSYQTSGTEAGQFNVIRTGTGNLELLAAGNLQELSPYGVYTAGAQQTAVDAAFAFGKTTLAGSLPVSYPTGGGNLLVAVQGNVGGFIQLDPSMPAYYSISTYLPSDGIGNWLWRDGGNGTPTAWGINFGSEVTQLDLGTYTDVQISGTPVPPQFVGFTGFGALGGGNITVLAGGNAGAQAGFNGTNCAPDCTSSGLDVAVASTGRVKDGSLTQTGGGDIVIRVGGAINPGGSLGIQQLNGTITDLRGTVSIRAGAIGQAPSTYQTVSSNDPRPISPLTATGVDGSAGITVVPGDATVSIETRRDLVIGAVSDATRLPQQYLSTTDTGSGLTWFSLWQPRTEVELFSLGGNVTPTTQDVVQKKTIINAYAYYDSIATEGGNVQSINIGDVFSYGLVRALYPPILTVVAANGNIAYAGDDNAALELAPSPDGQLKLLAAGTISGGNSIGSEATFDISGATTAVLATPLQPAFALSQEGHALPTALTGFAFGTDTPSGTLHANDTQPALVYAGVDIVNVRIGETIESTLPLSTLAVAAGKPVEMRAGNDIVNTGDTWVENPAPHQNNEYYTTAGDLFLNDSAADVSSIVAGRDIIYANAQILGPGTLEVQAGRDLYQAANGVLESLGVVNPTPGTLTGGAGIIALAGVGAAGPDWSRFAALYLNPANQAASGVPIEADAGNGKVAETYQSALLGTLQQDFGYTGSAADALGFFQALPATQQAPFLLPIYFDELRLSGREFTNPASVRYKSYARGREAIAALFPGTGYQGDITLYGPPAGTTTGGSLIRTRAGGAISILAPGGQLLLGRATDSPTAPNTGVLTEGQGDIGVYALDSVLLFQSRIFTTFGGGITIWSATGDINAGRSSNSVSVFSPVSITYDPFGAVTILPQPPATGGGIATLAPLAGTAAGDVDLIAPLGTIDAGEAGIRVSGNANLSALTVVNAANIQVQGHTTGLPSVAVPNLGALTAASAVSGASSQAAQQVAANQAGATAARQAESIISVEVTGFGGE